MRSLVERFEEKVDRSGECHEWRGAKNRPGGYGMIRVGKTSKPAHRVSYEVFVGEIPSRQCVLHRCDNPGCVNPEHLFLGSQADNVRDRDAKKRGRWHSGSKNARAKLSENDVRKIRHLYASGRFLQKDIAVEFGVSNQLVSRIVNNLIWTET